jgi:hypothetical protein
METIRKEKEGRARLHRNTEKLPMIHDTSQGCDFTGFDPDIYAMGYGLASFTTFATILGRYNYGSNEKGMCSCCSVLEQTENNGFIPALKTSFRNFVEGIRKMPQLHNQPNLMTILKTSLIILVTAETACILTAEIVDLLLYKSLFLSIPLALFAGAFTVVAPEAYKKTKRNMKKTITPSNNNLIGLERFNKK